MKTTKRILSALTALLLGAAALPVMPGSAADEVVKYEFESGTLTDCEERAPITWEKVDEDGFGNPCDMTGWSGDAYVYIDRKDATASVKVNVDKAGFYTLKVAYIQCFGTPDNPNKTQYLLVNGKSQGEVLFPFNSGKGWEELLAGYVYLDEGENEIAIKSYWGYTFLDYLTLSPAPSYLTNFTPDPTPCDPDATDEAKRLYHYLCDQYGEHILSGQQEYCGSHNYNMNAITSQGLPVEWKDYLVDNEAEFEYLEETTGKLPAIRGIDFLFYNTTKSYADDAPERVIAWYKDKGGIPTVTYHWNVPTDGKDSDDVAFYVEHTGNTPFTNFSISNAVKEGTWEHEKIDADITLLAELFGKIQAEGVPVIFRPLHEAEGGWFWWGAEGAEPCKELYHYLYDSLTKKYGIHNLIWEWTSSTNVTAADWYPGDAYVDMIGIDKYNAINNSEPNESALSASFYSLVASTGGHKMVAMSECDTIPSLENMQSEKAAWLYFCPWYQRYLTELNDPITLKALYTSDYCITLDELPDLSAYPLPDGKSDPYVTPDKPDTPSPSEETPEDPKDEPETPDSSKDTPEDPKDEPGTDDLLYGDVNLDGEVDIMDVIALNKFLLGTGMLSDEAKTLADADQNKTLDASDSLNILKYVVALVSKLPVTE